jgi:hypothetical protein
MQCIPMNAPIGLDRFRRVNDRGLKTDGRSFGRHGWDRRAVCCARCHVGPNLLTPPFYVVRCMPHVAVWLRNMALMLFVTGIQR